MKFDAHVHVFGSATRLRPERRYTPTYEATPRQLTALLDEHGLTGALLVQTSFAATPADLLEAAAAAPQRFRVVASPADLAELEASWESWQAAGVVGIRLNLLGRPAPDLSSPAWRAMGRKLADAEVHMEIHAEGTEWAVLRGALRSWPSPVVIDHLGRPTGPDPLTELGDAEHVWFKVSAPYRWPDRAVAEHLLDRLLDTTGGQRLLWGSDWPHTQHEGDTSYGSMIEVARTLQSSLEASFDSNLQRLLGAHRF